MKRRVVLIGASAGASAAVLSLLSDALLSHRDSATTAVTIGVLSGGFREEDLEAFRQQLRANGWVDGENIVIVHKNVTMDVEERLPAMASELVATGVRLIVTTGFVSTSAVMKTHPLMDVVMAGSGDPIAAGIVASLTDPGGHVTGVGTTASLDAKRLELLKEIIPTAERLAFITNLSLGAQPARTKVIASTAEQLGLRLRVIDIRTPAEIEPAFDDAAAWKAQMLFTAPTGPMSNAPEQVVALAARHRIPAVYSNLDWVRAGGLIGIGPDVRANYRLAADYVDKILRGAQPAQLPITSPVRGYELLVHRKALAALGLSLPPSVALQVTGWVE